MVLPGIHERGRCSQGGICVLPGKFEFLRMSFGVKKAPAVFQSLMTDVMQEFSLFARPYMDDIVIYSISWDSHKQHVRQVLECLRKAHSQPETNAGGDRVDTLPENWRHLLW